MHRISSFYNTEIEPHSNKKNKIIEISRLNDQQRIFLENEFKKINAPK